MLSFLFLMAYRFATWGRRSSSTGDPWRSGTPPCDT